MKGIFLGLGSNIGDKRNNLQSALRILSRIQGLTVKKQSAIYDTEPVGYTDQHYFSNMVVEVNYEFSPEILLKELKKTESGMGRIESFRWGPRIIDIDILYFDSLIISTDNLEIPHPEIRNRLFVLKPLLEIAGDFRCPISGKKITEIFEMSADSSYVEAAGC